MRAAAKNVEGLTYATQEAAASSASSRRRWRRSWAATRSARSAASRSRRSTRTSPATSTAPTRRFRARSSLVQYSNDFARRDKCQTVAQNEIGQGAKVLFQVAGGCGIGALKAAAAAKLWGIGVDADEYNDAPRILTSAIKKTDIGVYDAITQAAAGKFQGGTDLLLNLKNNGVGVGKINPAVPKSWITLMNSYRAKIIAGTLKPPAALVRPAAETRT